MADTAYGSELNIYYELHKIDEIIDRDKLYELMKDNLFAFEQDRETFPVDLDLDAQVKVNNVGDFLENEVWQHLSDQNYLVVGHYFIYSDASYEINNNLTEIDKKDFFGWTVFDYPYDDNGDSILELQGTGESVEEESFVAFKRGQDVHVFRESLRAPWDTDDELDDEQEQELRSISESVFSAL
jgi:hypothetical protein